MVTSSTIAKFRNSGLAFYSSLRRRVVSKECVIQFQRPLSQENGTCKPKAKRFSLSPCLEQNAPALKPK
ncbi:hypothetical protein RRG08_054336 [Elysia crispata]|uniref:Uncharacterized protein n=1 Tax=Elysia crispata TaxID=231223 RepID=A0AAE1B3L0_9GAST|nr:hypothetical protein RRG08_054336 [Elysia crispata]